MPGTVSVDPHATDWVHPNIQRWKYFSPIHKVELSAHRIQNGAESYFFDPVSAWLPPTGNDPAGTIFLTNENHQRGAAVLQSLSHYPVYASGRCRFSSRYFQFELVEAVPILPGGWQFKPLYGAAPGEVLYYHAEMKLAVFGDSLIRLKDSDPELLPRKYCANCDLLLAELTGFFCGLPKEPVTCLFAHGSPWTMQEPALFSPELYT